MVRRVNSVISQPIVTQTAKVSTTNSGPGPDRVYHGAKQIGDRLGLKERQVYRVVAAGHAWFIIKVGNSLWARESAIVAYFEQLERQARGGGDA